MVVIIINLFLSHIKLRVPSYRGKASLKHTVGKFMLACLVDVDIYMVASLGQYSGRCLQAMSQRGTRHYYEYLDRQSILLSSDVIKTEQFIGFAAIFMEKVDNSVNCMMLLQESFTIYKKER